MVAFVRKGGDTFHFLPIFLSSRAKPFRAPRLFTLPPHHASAPRSQRLESTCSCTARRVADRTYVASRRIICAKAMLGFLRSRGGRWTGWPRTGTTRACVYAARASHLWSIGGVAIAMDTACTVPDDWGHNRDGHVTSRSHTVTWSKRGALIWVITIRGGGQINSPSA